MENVASRGVNELIIPNYKQTRANIRKIADTPEVTRRLTFKSPFRAETLIEWYLLGSPIAYCLKRE
jgi:hypothetical protein